MKFKSVLRFDPTINMVRLFRVMWVRGNVGDGKGYSAKFSVALWPKLFRYERTFGGIYVTVAGIQLHYDRSYGGIHA